MAELDEQLNQPSESEKRINQLSGKLKEQSDATEAERQAREAAEAKSVEIERERDFYAGFSDVVATQPEAKDHKDDILAKVKSGYTVQDATFAVLGAAGKLNKAPEVPSSPAGGSAATSLPSQGVKTISEMTQDERRAELLAAESRGDISIN